MDVAPETFKSCASGAADHRGGNTDLPRQTPLKRKHALSGRRRHEGVNVNDLLSRSQASSTPDPLLEPRWIPRQIEMDHDGSSPQIDALAQQVRAEKKMDPFESRWRRCVAGELSENFLTGNPPAGDPRRPASHDGHAGIIAHPPSECAHCMRILAERDDARPLMCRA